MEPFLASTISHYEPIAKSLAVLLLFMAELILVGAVVVAWLPSRSRWTLSLPDFFLPGLFAVVAFAETWSLFGALMPWANFAMILAAAILALLRRRSLVGTLQEAARNTRRINLIPLALCLVFAAINALTNGFGHDTLLYHLAAIRWVAEFGSVPGLANLHGRLGFNSALHPLAALFGWPFGIEVGREFVNPMIIGSVCAVLLQGIKLRRKEFFNSDSIYAGLLFLLAFRLLFSECLSSPQPDVTGAGLTLLVVWHLRKVIYETALERSVGPLLACLIASALVVTFKLSYSVLGLTAAGLAVVIFYIRGRFFAPILAGAAAVILFSVPWLCRGYLTSGYPFYPSEIGRINFDWTVPAEAALNEKDSILSWGRAPFEKVQTGLQQPDWFWPWLSHNLRDPILWQSLLLAAAGLMLVAVTRLWQYPQDSWRRWCLLTCPVILSLLFWFATAPDPRFAEGTLWILAADVVYLPFVGRENLPRWARAFFAVVMIGLVGLDSIVGFGRLMKEPERFPNYVGVPVPMVLQLTYSGLAVWVPVSGDLTGPWQIPATPPIRFDPRLELRGETFREGFRVNLSWPKPKSNDGG